MLWVDGELDEARAAEVEAFVRRDARVRAVIAGLREGGATLAADALQDAGARGADSVVDRVMAAVEAEAGPSRIAPVRLLRKPRTVIAVGVAAAVSLAAAVTLFIGSQRTSPLTQFTGGRATSALVGEGPSLADFPGAIIDVVDFGARSGTIFYVPSEGDTTTAVVWLMEDDTSPATGESP
jgi:hypothetical protein